MIERLERSALAVAIGAVVFLLLGTVVVAFVPPLLDASMREPGPNPREVTDLAAAGEQIYVREGCQNCHTQLVRAVQADADLGPVTAPGDAHYQVPQLYGSVRIGPDLSCAANRFPEEGTADLIRSYLTDPGSAVTGSRMPSFEHLSDEDLDALTAYLLTRVCEGVERPEAPPPPGESPAATERPDPLTACEGAPESGDVELAISADNIQFDTDLLEGPVDCEPFTIVFENLESAPHNVSIYTDSTLAQTIFQEEPIAEGTATYEIPPLPAAEYYFQCDVHPAMNGTLVVS